MNITKIDYRSNGSKDTYSIPFDFIAEEDVKVMVDNTELDFKFLNKKQIVLSSIPASGEVINIFRRTDLSIPAFLYYSQAFNDETYSLDADDMNKIKQQILYGIQEYSEQQVDSVGANPPYKNEMFLELDMNDNLIINVANPTNQNNAVPLQFFIELFPDLPIIGSPEVGIKINDTYLSSRFDEESYFTQSIRRNINREFEQTLWAGDYPELADVYGNVGGFTTLPAIPAPTEGESGTGEIEQIILNTTGYDGITTNFLAYNVKKDRSYGRITNILYETSQDGTSINIYDAGATIDAFFYDNEDEIGILTARNSNKLEYTLDEGQTFNACNFINGTPTLDVASVYRADDIYVATTNSTATSSRGFYYSYDGINWYSKDLITDFGYDFSKTSFSTAFKSTFFKLCKSFWKGADGYYYHSIGVNLKTGTKYVVYKINPDFSGAVEYYYGSSLSTTTSSLIVQYFDETGFSVGSTVDGSLNNNLFITTNWWNSYYTIDLNNLIPGTSDARTATYSVLSKYDDSFIFVMVDYTSNNTYVLKSDLLFQTITVESVHNYGASSSYSSIYGKEWINSESKMFISVSSGDDPFGLYDLISTPIGNTIHKYYTKGK